MIKVRYYKPLIIFWVLCVALGLLIPFGIKPLLSYSFNLFNDRRIVSQQLDNFEDRIGVADSLLQYNYTVWDKIQSVKKSVPSTGKASYILDKLLAEEAMHDLVFSDMFALGIRAASCWAYLLKPASWTMNTWPHLKNLEGSTRIDGMKGL